MNVPRFPVYVISKGRADCCLTAKFLMRDGVPFKLVIEPQERAAYEAAGFGAHIVTLPFSNLGLGGIPARNWCWEDAKAAGHERHWILDDNIRDIWHTTKGNRFGKCHVGDGFVAVEKFLSHYDNVAIAGLNYQTFCLPGSPPFNVNVHVYSCLCIQNDLPFRWRGRYNEDTDLCLQVLSAGLCTVLVNAYTIGKVATMTMKGGNSAELYKGDGRLKMARSLERVWPGIVQTRRRFKRPQHVVNWRIFTTPLRRKATPPKDEP